MQGFDLTIGPQPRRTCRVRVGAGALDGLTEELRGSSFAARWFLISDDHVAPLHAEPLQARLRSDGLRVDLLRFPAGEASKTRETKQQLEDRLLELGAGRDSALLAVGGGVTGDLAGFLAATWHRGVPVVQVPTSLLAMVDAAVGGKTAVNLGPHKNLVGAFHQPLSIWVDLRVLDTLPDDRLVEGCAEIVKAAAVGSAQLFRWLEQNAEALLARDPVALEHAVATCIKLKARVVARDERETGSRAALNFGHTIGHALEAVTGYAISHGEAVAVGMCAEARIAGVASGFPEGHRARLERLLERFGLPTRPPREIALDSVLDATRRDKKVRGGRVRYAFPLGLGRMPKAGGTTTEVDDATVAYAWSKITE